MKLVFYGGGGAHENIEVDKQLDKLIESKDPVATFIPSSSYEAEFEFKDFVEQYSKIGIERFLYFPIDLEYDEVMLSEVLSGDLIHLGGGNTFYFLKYLRKTKLIKDLKSFVECGGILTGVSAGAILMTPNITTASFPVFDKDENDENIKNYGSLNLVDFEFFPHYKNSNRYEKELVKYSKASVGPVYACPDGSGIVVSDYYVQFVGRTYVFFQGKRIVVDG